MHMLFEAHIKGLHDTFMVDGEYWSIELASNIFIVNILIIEVRIIEILKIEAWLIEQVLYLIESNGNALQHRYQFNLGFTAKMNQQRSFIYATMKKKRE